MKTQADIVLQHHERFDGSGYPNGLSGAQICLGARIFAVADAYDAIRAERPYSHGRRPEEAATEIVRYRGTQFDPAVVTALLDSLSSIESLFRTSWSV